MEYRIVLKRLKPKVINVRMQPWYIRRWIKGKDLDDAIKRALSKFKDCQYCECVGEREQKT